MPTEILRLENVDSPGLEQLLANYGLQLERVAAGAAIPGSYWGDEEAGLRGHRVFARADTPLHSILHETCHYICMDEARRRRLDTDAGSDDSEENAVCYLQILLADRIRGYGRERMLREMDAWGYSFRLGSARAWFDNDAEDALNWLISKDLISADQSPTLRLRR